jgi:hypothetical protein
MCKIASVPIAEKNSGEQKQSHGTHGSTVANKGQVVLRQHQGHSCVLVFDADKPGDFPRNVNEIANNTKMHVLQYQGDFALVRSLDKEIEGWVDCRNVTIPKKTNTPIGTPNDFAWEAPLPLPTEHITGSVNSMRCPVPCSVQAERVVRSSLMAGLSLAFVQELQC